MKSSSSSSSSTSSSSSSLLQSLLSTASDPSQWSCVVCGSTDEMVLCLASGSVYCTSEEDGHASAAVALPRATAAARPSRRTSQQPQETSSPSSSGHASPSPHLCISLHAPFPVQDMMTGEALSVGLRASARVRALETVALVAAVRSRLRSLHSLGGARWVVARGWAKVRMAVRLFGVRHLAHAAALKRHRSDAQATALRQWASLDVARAFRTWHARVKEGRGAAGGGAGFKRSRAPEARGTAAQRGGGGGGSSSNSSASTTTSAGGSLLADTLPRKRRQPATSTAGPEAEAEAAEEALIDFDERMSHVPRPPPPKSALERETRLGHTGLRNLGNTCFMNASLQSLLHVPLFRAYLFAERAPTHLRILEALHALITASDSCKLGVATVFAEGGGGGLAGKPSGGGAAAHGKGASGGASSSKSFMAGSTSAPAHHLHTGLHDLLLTGPLLPKLLLTPEAAAEEEGGAARSSAASSTKLALKGGRGGGGSSVTAGTAANSAALSMKKNGKDVEPSKKASSSSSSLTAASITKSSLSRAPAPVYHQLSLALHEVASRLFGFQPMAVYSPDAFLKIMWVAMPQFGGFHQQDAEEFLRAMLSCLCEEATGGGAPMLSSSPSSTIKSSSSLSSSAAAAAVSTPCPLKEMLTGKTCTTITCTVCGRASRNEETFFGPLTIEIPPSLVALSPSDAKKKGPCALQAALDNAFSHPETLEGDSAFACGHCGKKTRAILRRSLAHLPPILILHIARCSWAAGGSKIHTVVSVPLVDLYTTKWMEDSGIGGVSGGAGATASSSSSPSSSSSSTSAHASSSSYDLHGVVQHMGSGFKAGHYMAYARNGREEEWYCFNDSRISVAKGEDVEALAGGYVYIFQKRLNV